MSPDPSLFLDVEVGSPERGARRFAEAGKVLYMEFPSADIERAQRFWSGVLGWRFGSGLTEGFDYRMAQVGSDAGVARGMPSTCGSAPRLPNARAMSAWPLPAELPVMVYAWGNNSRRAELSGRRCVVLARGRMNTILVQFLDTGEKVTTSRFAVRRT